jgi:hypothetical protein
VKPLKECLPVESPSLAELPAGELEKQAVEPVGAYDEGEEQLQETGDNNVHRGVLLKD